MKKDYRPVPTILYYTPYIYIASHFKITIPFICLEQIIEIQQYYVIKGRNNVSIIPKKVSKIYLCRYW